MFFYNAAISLYFAAIQLAGLFNPKIKLLARAQRNWKNDLDEKTKHLKGRSAIWVHCASVGEFEQGRPLIEALKQRNGSQPVVLSFFSPSGYELHKNYPLADAVVYLPKDTKSNAARFIEHVNPSLVLFVKYEFWLNFLFTLQKKNIRTYLVSAVIKEHQPFFKWYGGIFKKALRVYTQIFVQDAHSLQLLERLKIPTGLQCGDTRIDRVTGIAAQAKELPAVKEFAQDANVIIAGSSWATDERYMIDAFVSLKKKYKNTRLIIVPHEVDADNIQRLKKELQAAGLGFELYTSGNLFAGKDVLVVDTIGLLSSLYRYGSIAYIGGGFGNGIHNILEPAVFGLPVLFGPNHRKFVEAQRLLGNGGAAEITNGQQLETIIGEYLTNPDARAKAGNLCLQYVNANKGATEKILEQIDSVISLKNS